MATNNILASIDTEIARLQQARALLSGTAAPQKRGRKPGQKNSAKAPAKKVAKRVMSPEARKRIGDAQRKRWAAQKAAAKPTKKSSAKKAATKKAAPAATVAAPF